MRKIISLCLCVCVMLSMCTWMVSAGESWLWPLGSVYGYNRISSSYGYRTYNNKNHNGIDIAAPNGTTVYATRSGKVTICGYDSSQGNHIYIDHGDGYVSIYMHLSSQAVSKGQTVSRGQVIGAVGNTGASDGAHLHFAIKYNGNYYNPNPSDYGIQGSVVNGQRGNISYSFDIIESGSPERTESNCRISDTSRIIKYGQSGDHVRELQECLNHLENAGLKIDGKFGDATHTAVKNFQAKHGLSVDGDAGPKTLGKINELIRAQSTVHNHFEKLAGKNYESAHPHRVYETCICGEEWRYTGETQKVNGCSECYHTHSYTTKYESEHPHKQYAICDCGDKNYTGKTRTVDGCDDCHEHSYITKYEGEHPHKQYKICDCGEKNYTGKTREVKSCEICNPSVKRVIKLQIGVPSMYIDGVEAEIDPGRGTSAILYGGRTLLPIRAIAESFGASVVWDEIEQKVTIYSEDTTIQLWIDEYKAKVNSVTRTVDVAPMLVNGRTFMPIRFIAESLGLSVGWNDANQTVTIEGEI